MVAGPQVGYFNPQILMEQDVHAPAGPDGPGIDAQGASFVGINLYVQLGRGRDYAWSATSAGPGHHRHLRARALRRHALPLPRPLRADRGAREDQPLGADAGRPDRRRARRSCAPSGPSSGLVAGRGKVHGKPVIFTKLRSTYFHEVDSAAGLHGLQHARRSCATRRPSSARRRRSATRSTGSTPTPSTSRTSTRARTRCARQGRRTTTSRSPAKLRVAGLEPRHVAGALHAVRAAPAGGRPELPRQLEQQAGARLPLRPTQNAYSSTYRSDMLEDRVKAGIAGARS